MLRDGHEGKVVSAIFDSQDMVVIKIQNVGSKVVDVACSDRRHIPRATDVDSTNLLTKT